MPKCRRDARFLFARKRCPTGFLILEGAQKKPFETTPFLSGFGINWRQKQWLWHAIAPPNKAKRKGLQRHGRRCQVCHRSRLKEAKKLSEPRIPIGFLKKEGAQLEFWSWRVPKKTLWNKAFSIRLWNKLAPGQRRRVFQRSRLKDRCPNAGVMLDFFLQEKGAQLDFWSWRVPKKNLLKQSLFYPALE